MYAKGYALFEILKYENPAWLNLNRGPTSHSECLPIAVHCSKRHAQL